MIACGGLLASNLAHSELLPVRARWPREKAMPRPTWLPILDRVSISLGAIVWTTVILRIAPTFGDSLSLAALILGCFAGYVFADFLSGLVHWLADRYFDPRTPILGPALIAPFREHHADALAMTRHDFFELSGNNALATLPLALALLFFPETGGFLFDFLAATISSLGLSIIATNQFHCWAHSASPPSFVRRMQHWGLILSPERHAVHHGRDHDRSYCVTSGWLNPLLDRIRFFDRVEHLIEVLFRRPRRAT